MSLSNENIIELLNYIISSDDLSLIYKKVFVKKIINKYMLDNNKDIIQNFIKNNEEIYNYIFLNDEKKKKQYQKALQQHKLYYQDNKEILKEKGRQYYQEHREQQLKQKKEYYQRKKQEKQQEELNSKK